MLVPQAAPLSAAIYWAQSSTSHDTTTTNTTATTTTTTIVMRPHTRHRGSEFNPEKDNPPRCLQSVCFPHIAHRR